MKRYIIILLTALIILTLGTGCKKKDDNSLKVGMELEFAPFEMTDEKGDPTGISVELANALGEYLGREIVIENMSFSGLLPSLLTSKIDVIISSMTISEERKEQVNFSEPYAKIYLALLLNKDSKAEDFNSLDQQGRTIAVRKGTTGHMYAEENLKNAKINVFEKENTCVLEVTQGKADAFIYDQMSIYKHFKNNPDTTRANLEPFQEDIEGWGIAVRKEDTKLLEDINRFIEKFKSEGGFDTLSDKYLSEEKKAFEELGITFFFD
jgi:polar amino acid transport system substrate-binding protein